MGAIQALGQRDRVRPALEVADIFRAHGAAYRYRYPVSRDQSQAMWSIVNCRTSTLGGHVDECNVCSYSRPSWNSCRSRSCPKCQGSRQAAWVAERSQRTLNCPHFHCVFTLPAELRPLALRNPRVVYGILFRAASQTLLDLGKDPRWLGAQIGATGVLHTWGSSNLAYHPHVHFIVTAGGLSQDGTRWIPNRWGARYLFPVRVLSSLFRAKFLRLLTRAYNAGKLSFRGACEELACADTFQELKSALHAKPWVVYSKRPFAGAT